MEPIETGGTELARGAEGSRIAAGPPGALPRPAARPQLLERDLTGFTRSLEALWAVARRRGFVRLVMPEAHGAIVAVARAARDSGLRPEQFIWLVKQSWATLPDVRSAADPLATREVLGRIITVCIDEFYRE